jgi:hypothetical protein
MVASRVRMFPLKIWGRCQDPWSYSHTQEDVRRFSKSGPKMVWRAGKGGCLGHSLWLSEVYWRESRGCMVWTSSCHHHRREHRGLQVPLPSQGQKGKREGWGVGAVGHHTCKKWSPALLYSQVEFVTNLLHRWMLPAEMASQMRAAGEGGGGGSGSGDMHGVVHPNPDIRFKPDFLEVTPSCFLMPRLLKVEV